MIPSALAGLAAFVVYLFLTPAVSGPGDGPEFTIVLSKAALAHPTGYPLYTMAGHLFTRLAHALGAPWPLAANAWSGVGGALAVALFYALARRLANPGLPGVAGRGLRETAALLPTVLLAFNSLAISEATIAEVNAWTLAWTCGIALVFVRAIARIETGRGEDAPLPLRDAAVWGLLCGAGLAHHLTSLWISACLSLALLIAVRRHIRPSHVAVAVGAAILPLASYGFVAWRAWYPAPGQWPSIRPSLGGVIEHISGVRYSQFLGFYKPDEAEMARLYSGVYPYLFPGIALLLAAGARAVSATQRILWWGLLAATLIVMLFGFQYGVPDPAPYFLPGIALGLLGLAPLVVELGSLRAIPSPARLAAGVLVLAGATALSVASIGEARGGKEMIVRSDRAIRAMWRMVRPDTAIVIWPADQCVRLIERQVLLGERPGLYVMNPDLLVEGPVRKEMVRRFGVDPLEGLELPALSPHTPNARQVHDQFLMKVIHGINERTRVPVVLFDPSVPMVREMPKP
jgi:hypothetical protein